jgi:PPOX class probable F420-dependent enzyme
MTATTHAPAARSRRFLETEMVIWLATVDAAARPAIVPVWFWWDGDAILVASKPGARKVRNIRANERVMVGLGDPNDDFDVGLIEATAELVEIPTRALLSAGLAAKYQTRMAAIGLSPDEFAATYAQVIRIVPTRPLPWRGRTRPEALPDPSSTSGPSILARLGAMLGWLAGPLRGDAGAS